MTVCRQDETSSWVHLLECFIDDSICLDPSSPVPYPVYVHVAFPQLRELKLAKKVIGKQWFKGTAASRISDQDPAKISAEQVISVAPFIATSGQYSAVEKSCKHRSHVGNTSG